MMQTIIGETHHIGYLVKNIDKTLSLYQQLGFELVTEKKYDEIRKSYLCFLKVKGECIELIEPTRESELCPLMKKYVNTPYHICYKVDNLQAAISKLKEIGFLIFKDIEKAPVISSHAEVAFLMHSRIGIIELVQGVE